jgi:hypothetical protein
MDEQQFLTPKDVLGYAEEYIVAEEIQQLLNYSLSNSLDDIKIAIYARTGLDIDLNDAYWQLNTELSTIVKHLMNKHRVNYSMTIREEEKFRFLSVNMRVGDQWFQTRFYKRNKDSTFLDLEKSRCYERILKCLKESDTDS